ncbi:MAG: SUMF1/EgtB/PvdO family nonheme iron enzyme [Gammaproteobacteria bacterium]|nr:SUMF1/EgtB/PvdO family nonheme iron enzyme [Gammaproteobacteria bacterium]MBQ0840736.1 SUMF1/EgtB/PvdO family nonheme iron enzyme [Gammaproteobacteria bacterium]
MTDNKTPSATPDTINQLTDQQTDQQTGHPISPTITPIDFSPLDGTQHQRGPQLRPVPVLISLLLFIAAALLWFLLTARSVEFKLSPTTATLDVSAGLSFHLGERYLMRPGEFQLTANAPGYFELQQALLVSAEDQQSYPLTLEKMPGHLTINGEPKTVQISLQNKLQASSEDGRQDARRGETPLTLRDLPPGSYSLKAEAERYFPQSMAIDIEGLDITQQVDIDLQAAWGHVQINSEPTGAEILVNGKSQGTTPLQINILESGEPVTLLLPGYKAWQQTLSVTAGEQREWPLVELQAVDGLLALSSQPEGAGITHNGHYLGTTPLQIELPPGKPQQLQLYLAGYYPASHALTVASGERRQLKIALKPKLGKLKISAQPAGAQLYINGNARGSANQSLKLLARPQRIEVRKAGYTSHFATLTPQPGVERLLRINLPTEAQTRAASIPATITAPSGQKLKLFRPKTIFSLGASRREQGRRANEILRKVSLQRPFYLSSTEVTNQQFHQFQGQHSSNHASGKTLNQLQQPVVSVTWTSAAQFCNWLSQQQGLAPFYIEEDGKISGYATESTGYRLPTEAEWAWAARWQQGKMAKFPWGTSLLPAHKSSNIADRSAAKILPRVLNGYNDGFAVSAPVASLPTNNKGLYDMGGNVAEWVNDYYSIAANASGSVETDPLGPDKGQFKIVRGASWRHSGMTELRLSFRDYSESARDDLGFRIARYAQ